MDKELSNSWLFYSETESQWLCCTLWSQTRLSSYMAEAELLWKMQEQHSRWQKGIPADFLEAAAVLPTSNPCPQPPKRLLTNLAHKTLCKSHIALQSQRLLYCSSQWYTCICIFKQTRNQSSLLHLFFTWGENHRFTFHWAVTQLELLPVNMYHKNEGKISKNLHNIFQLMEWL